MLENLTLKDVRKFLVALAAFLGNLVALNVLPDPWQGYAVAALSGLGALGVYATRNGEPVEDVLEIFMEQDDEPLENPEV